MLRRLGEAAGRRERGRDVGRRAGDGDAARGQGGQVEGVVARAGGEEEAEAGELLRQGGGEGRALAHGGDDGVGLQAGDEGLEVGVWGDGVGVGGDFELGGGEVLEVGGGEVLVVVEDGHFDGPREVGWGGGRHGGGGLLVLFGGRDVETMHSARSVVRDVDRTER